MLKYTLLYFVFFFFQAEDGIRDYKVTGVQTCALPISGQRNVVAQVCGPHPAEVGPPKPPVVMVVEEISLIVPVHKLVLEHWQEGGEGDESNQRGDQPEAPSLGQSAGHRFTAFAQGWLRVLGFGGRSRLTGRAPAAHWCARDLMSHVP